MKYTSHYKLSLAYFFGTLGSSLFLTQAGRWFDRFGGRIMMTISSIALSLMVLYTSFVEEIGKLFGGSPVLVFILISRFSFSQTNAFPVIHGESCS